MHEKHIDNGSISCASARGKGTLLVRQGIDDVQKDVVRSKVVLDLKERQELLRCLILNPFSRAMLLQLYNHIFDEYSFGGSKGEKGEMDEKGKSLSVWSHYDDLLRAFYQNVRRASLSPRLNSGTGNSKFLPVPRPFA